MCNQMGLVALSLSLSPVVQVQFSREPHSILTQTPLYYLVMTLDTSPMRMCHE